MRTLFTGAVLGVGVTIPTTTENTQSNSRVTVAIIEAVATEADVDPAAMPPLFERIDPDALDALFAPTMTGSARSGTIEFPYCGYEVSVRYDDDVSVTLEQFDST